MILVLNIGGMSGRDSTVVSGQTDDAFRRALGSDEKDSKLSGTVIRIDLNDVKFFFRLSPSFLLNKNHLTGNYILYKTLNNNVRIILCNKICIPRLFYLELVERLLLCFKVFPD